MTTIKEDYILRMVEMAAMIIARALGLKDESKLEEAKDVLDEGIADLLGAQADIIAMVDSATAARLIGDPRLVTAYASLLAEKAQLSSEDHDWLMRRSFELTLEAQKMDPMLEAAKELIQCHIDLQNQK